MFTFQELIQLKEGRSQRAQKEREKQTERKKERVQVQDMSSFVHLRIWDRSFHFNCPGAIRGRSASENISKENGNSGSTALSLIESAQVTHLASYSFLLSYCLLRAQHYGFASVWNEQKPVHKWDENLQYMNRALNLSTDLSSATFLLHVHNVGNKLKVRQNNILSEDV